MRTLSILVRSSLPIVDLLDQRDIATVFINNLFHNEEEMVCFSLESASSGTFFACEMCATIFASKTEQL
jgi:hypothetical protein